MSTFVSKLAIKSRNICQSGAKSRYLSTIRFSVSHEYIKLDGNVGTIGITDHAANALGDVVYVDLPSVGAKFTAGKSFGSVESVKAASDVYAPVAGEVLETNATLVSTPGTVNESPYENGWFIKLTVNSQGLEDFKKLLDEKAYKAHLESSK